jgi:SAV_6107-like HEPN
MGQPPESDGTAAGRPTPPPNRAGLGLLAQARSVLAEARFMPEAAERFRLAHLAALRVAAALFAARSQPATRPHRLRSAWALLESVAPELADWAAYFAGSAGKRAAVEAGAISIVSDREADDQLLAAQRFLAIVERELGLLIAPLAS